MSSAAGAILLLFVLLVAYYVYMKLKGGPVLYTNEYLASDSRPTSKGNQLVSGMYALRVDPDNNVSVVNALTGSVAWRANPGIVGLRPFTLTMQPDGNLVLYDSTGLATWASDSHGQGTGPYTLQLNSSGVWAVVDSTNKVVRMRGDEYDLQRNDFYKTRI